MAERKPFVGGNWKMSRESTEARDFQRSSEAPEIG